ncbi:formate dehydrogenase accessory protein FdhE [Pelomonas sp. SE-A7]|uniref:formate dehydrogenase accessory protein FdhE n=1 Tax=Pelomonas sp. SE-A7 TaxID=3054953 RepID=UPI00259CBC91|nr:formate dehydrogenase accessory protein FdhE [Pelomonas sp. SE-A7]MDM4765874.1 formate dehydrogenase accessory protein FdhE [Pelomonas sp. SE-A7]
MTLGTQATIKLMSPEEIAAGAGGAPVQELRLPEVATLFAERSLRLRQLAAGHAMRDYLIFIADLSQAQHAVLQRLGELPLPTPSEIAAARAVGRPPLPAADWPRDPAWQAALRDIVDELAPRAPAATQATLQALREADADWLETQADCLLNGVMLGLDLAAAPLVAAALQVYWTRLVTATASRFDQPGQLAFARIEDETLCPCCGSRPTASITRQIGDVAGQRYLHCSLCAAEWHMVRIQCPHCLSGLKLAYESLEAIEGTVGPASPSAVQAETCGDCGHYLKIVHTERDPFVEPAADDLASLTLDLLLSETGLRRHGLNLMLLFGEPEPPPDSPPSGRS